MLAVCSNRPRPSVHSGAKGGQWWARDVYHLRCTDAIRTLCGRPCDDWLVIGELHSHDRNLCARCAKAAGLNPEGAAP